MSARKTNRITRLLVAICGVAALGGAASAQPNALRYEGDPSYRAPDHRGHIVAHITVDCGECHDVWECDDPAEVLLDALLCEGYDAWIEGCSVVVDRCHGEPRIRVDSREFRLTKRRGYDEVRYTFRQRYHHHEAEVCEKPVVIRDTYRVEPGIVFGAGITFEGDGEPRFDLGLVIEDGCGFAGCHDRGCDGDCEFAGEYTSGHGGRFDDDRYERHERPGNRDERFERPSTRGGVREYGRDESIPSYETQRPTQRQTERQTRRPAREGVEFDLERGFTSRRDR